jgi:hypothetical protein
MTCASHHGNQAAISKIRPVKLIATASAPDKPASDKGCPYCTWTPKMFKSGHFLICFAYDSCFLVQIGAADLWGLMPAGNQHSSRQTAISQGRGR